MKRATGYLAILSGFARSIVLGESADSKDTLCADDIGEFHMSRAFRERYGILTDLRPRGSMIITAIAGSSVSVSFLANAN